MPAEADIAPLLPFPDGPQAPTARPARRRGPGKPAEALPAGKAGRRGRRGRTKPAQEPAPRATQPAFPDPVEELAATLHFDTEAGADAAAAVEHAAADLLAADVIPPAIAVVPASARLGNAIIDSDEEVPEGFWGLERAGPGPRFGALLVDQLLLGALLGVFAAAAFAALRLSGFEREPLLEPAVWWAAAPPFALLALMLSFGYYVFFDGSNRRTPGKRLAGIAVRTLDGGAPSFRRAAGRWLAGLLSCACAGAGFAWALVGPRRMSWPDILSGTLLGTRRPAAGVRR